MSEQALASARPTDLSHRTIVTTLIDLITALADAGATDTEVVTVLSDLANTGRVRRGRELRVSPARPEAKGEAV